MSYNTDNPIDENEYVILYSCDDSDINEFVIRIPTKRSGYLAYKIEEHTRYRGILEI